MTQLIEVQIDGGELLELDVDLSTLTMREAVTLEEVLGGETFDALMSGKASMRPSLIRAVVYAKLKTLRPELALESFDLDLGALTEALSEEGGPPKLAGVG